jgi:hypothetical protein
MEQVTQMSVNSRRDLAEFTEQNYTESSELYTKDDELPVHTVICSRLPLLKSEV